MAGSHVTYRGLYIVCSEANEKPQFEAHRICVLLSVRENTVDWVCGVQEGYRSTTISLFITRQLEAEWRIVFLDIGSTKGKLCFSQWHIFKQLLFGKETDTEWESIYSCFFIIIIIIPLIAITPSIYSPNTKEVRLWEQMCTNDTLVTSL